MRIANEVQNGEKLQSIIQNVQLIEKIPEVQ
jgi:hypothetical protein